tara:strand:- start:5079 stop:6242 length:1164 start_codon:yes stop_codon:yes gene_type:complete
LNLSSKFFDIPEFDFDGEKQKFVENLNFLKSMSVQEQTLYKKWQEFNKNEYNMRNKVTNFPKYYNRLWKPTDITNKELTIKEIESIEPEVVFVPSDDASNWTMYRMLIHTMDWSANPGRNQKYFIRDKVTDKILGLVSLGSDVTSIKVRDDYIGWSKDNKFVDHKLNNTAIASTIVCTQPIGFNFLGGKLIAALTTSSVIRNNWYEQYNDILIGVTTTSLYGVHSQYNGIPHWKTLGESAGKIAIKPDDDAYFVWANWLKKNYREEFDKAQSQTGPKQNTINRIFKHLGIKTKDYEHGFHRGVFFANMYDNGLEYLRNEIKDKDLRMKPKFENDIDYIMNWWKPKAIRRYVKLYEDNRIKPEVLFYGDIVGKTWEETKEQYIKEVGR